MTLDAIRARAGTHPGVSEDSELRAVIDVLEAWDGTGAPPDIPDHLRPDIILWLWYDRAARDRAALLAVAEAVAMMPTPTRMDGTCPFCLGPMDPDRMTADGFWPHEDDCPMGMAHRALAALEDAP